MKTKGILKCLLATVLFATVGCASLKFDKDRASQVKKVAILAIEIHQQQPKDALGLSRLKGGPAKDSPVLKRAARTIYEDLGQSLTQQTQWKVVGFRDLVTNKTYNDKVKSEMSGARMITMTGSGYEVIVPDGVLDITAFEKMSVKQKQLMAKSLGVDAYAKAMVYVSIDQGYSLGNLTGDADFSSQAQFNFWIYDMASDEPLFQVQNVEGNETTSSGDLAESLTKYEKMGKLATEASSSAISKALSSIQL